MTSVDLTPTHSGDDHLLDREELNRRNIEFESATPTEIIRWAADRFGDRLVVTSSFGDAVLAHLAWQAVPGIEVVLIDTTYLFAETLWFADHAAELFSGRVRIQRPAEDVTPDNQWLDDTVGCCARRKVAPLAEALQGNAAWITGLRRDDSLRRATAPILSNDLLRGVVKVNPIANWTEADVDSYTIEHCLPVHPMTGRGYTSIGCWPCTIPPRDESDARSGRWAGQNRTECGLHD
ncbi:MAG: phosphoadenylyl-sulfate reductase [Acidobacteria bacterium]|nr:phosphoadenylyl-sulfate reductase [Acidobacteriota bacterium]